MWIKQWITCKQVNHWHHVMARRGRPPGSKNKRITLNRDHLVSLCHRENADPGLFLIGVMKGTDTSDEWTAKDRLSAAKMLMAHTYDRPQRESEVELIAQLRAAQQAQPPVYEIVYEQSQAGESVSAKTDTEAA